MNTDILMLKLMQEEGIGARTIMRILRAAEEAQCDPEVLLSDDSSDLFVRFRIPRDLIGRLGTDSTEAESLLKELHEHDIRMIMYASDDYPIQLVQALGDAAAPALFVHGNPSLWNQPTVAVCGSRNVSSAGSEATSTLVNCMADHGINIVSGGAAGVDQAAHNAAIASGGVTTLVLPTGILGFNMTDPLVEAAGRSKLLMISEFHPRAKWTTWGAMQRNSTIVALSQAVVAVEPGATGGTFEAAKVALKLGRPLYLLTCGGDDLLTEGHRYFLRRGAMEVRVDAGSLSGTDPLIAAIKAGHD